jgi:hypothetical protein
VRCEAPFVELDRLVEMSFFPLKVTETNEGVVVVRLFRQNLFKLLSCFSRHILSQQLIALTGHQ